MKFEKWMSITLLAAVGALGMPIDMAAQASASQVHEVKYHKYKLFDLGT